MEYTPEQQAENREKWFKALESGDYSQGVGKLKNPTTYNETLDNPEDNTYVSYCCLGVACEISGLGEWNDDITYSVYVIDNREQASLLLPEVQAWLGLKDSRGEPEDWDNNPEVVNLEGFVEQEDKPLTVLNDGGLSFKEIASILRANKGVYY